jgi:hypothetical protein
MCLVQFPLRDSYSDAPQVNVLALQHGKSVPRQVALLCFGPQRPSRALKGSISSILNVSVRILGLCQLEIGLKLTAVNTVL